MPGEWRTFEDMLAPNRREVRQLPRRLVLSAARLALNLNFEPMNLDMLAIYFKLMYMDSVVGEDQDDPASVHELIREKLFRLDEGSLASEPEDAGSLRRGAPAGLEQYRALGQFVLDVSKKLLQPHWDEQSGDLKLGTASNKTKSADNVSLAAMEQARPRTPDERFHYFEGK
eukprot:735262-Rhodomonas_salina.1